MRSESVSLGKKLLDNAFSDLQLNFKSISSDAINAVLKNHSFKELDDLYEDIGLGDQLAVFVAHQLANASEEQTDAVQRDGEEGKPFLIHGADGMAIDFSKCCCPIPGDSIVAFLNKGHGLDIHTEDCSTLIKLRKKQPEKCLPVLWADDVSGNFRVALNVEARNRARGLAEMAEAIAKANSFIDDVGISERGGGCCLVRFHLFVKNVSHLDRVLRHLRNASVVIRVARKKGD
jgi:guanosine-3',5'-bis(diphosphate) 3'-pyrophosphohydrolase